MRHDRVAWLRFVAKKSCAIHPKQRHPKRYLFAKALYKYRGPLMASHDVIFLSQTSVSIMYIH